MHRLIRPARALVFSSIAIAALASTATAAPTSTKFGPTVQVQQKTLQLNGAGTRYKLFFKVYDLGLYTPAKAATPEALLAMPGPMSLQFTALRELNGTDLGLLFIKGMSANSPQELVRKHTASTTRLIEIFSGKPKLDAGDRFAMEYVPGQGTTFYIQGKPQGAPVGDDEFWRMVLKIWVGPSPADPQLKKALLGEEP